MTTPAHPNRRRATRNRLVLAVIAATAAALPAAASADAGPEVPRTTTRATAAEPTPALSESGSGGGRTCVSHLRGRYAVELVAQNFEPGFDQYDSEAADDFRVDRRCRARSLMVVLDHEGLVVPERATLTFLHDRDGRPGRTIWRQNVQAVGDPVALTMPIDPPPRLRPTRDYWVSLQIDLDFALGGEVRIWTVRMPGDRAPTLWRNPGDGFGTGCTDGWTPAEVCLEGAPVGRLALEISTRFEPPATDRVEHP